MLGVPAKDRDIFKTWSSDVGRILDPILTPEIVAQGHAVIASMSRLGGLVARARGTR
jgi:hypothetical protein